MGVPDGGVLEGRGRPRRDGGHRLVRALVALQEVDEPADLPATHERAAILTLSTRHHPDLRVQHRCSAGLRRSQAGPHTYGNTAGPYTGGNTAGNTANNTSCKQD